MKPYYSRNWDAAGEQAAQWMCELREAGRKERASFVAWLKESPRNVREFLMAAAMLRAFEDVGPRDADELKEAIAEALRQARHSNIVTLDASPRPALYRDRGRTMSGSLQRVRGKVKIAAPLAAAVAAIVIGIGWWGIATLVSSPTYATDVGEQRAVRLADGSLLHLNTHSRVTVRFSANGRDVDLIDGEALFAVAKEPGRPFRVHSGASVIEALGTQFNVYRRHNNTTVSVIEGIVQVLPDSTAARSSDTTKLIVGEAVQIAKDGRVSRQKTPDIAEAIAWREHRLVFRAERLEDIAAEFNRYNPQRIRVEGEALRNRRFTGTGTANAPESFVRFLAKDSDLIVETTQDEFVISERNGR